MVNICVIALIGLPGAGKTTFCKNMVDLSSEYNILHICYDEFFRYDPESNEHTFKNERKKVSQKIEQLINEIQTNTCQDNKDSRSNSLKLSVLLVDDNNYYAGMRYEIYKICKAHQLSFGQIYFPIDEELAHSRNTTRGQNAIPSHVISKMNNRLEVPSDKNQWEQNALVIHDSVVDVEEFWAFLKICFLNPVKVTQEIRDHSTTEVSFIHNVDLCLRKRIKELLQNSNGNLSQNARILNDRRKCILLDLKHKNAFDDILNVQSICERLTL